MAAVRERPIAAAPPAGDALEEATEEVVMAASLRPTSPRLAGPDLLDSRPQRV
jgi:hypothetical protein